MLPFEVIRREMKIINMIFDLFFPKICAGCGEHISFSSDFLCKSCRRSFDEEINVGCLGCGKPYHECGCKPHFLSGKTLITTMPYKNENSVSRQLIISCKRKKNREIFDELSENMAKALMKNGIGENYAVTFTPRSPKAVEKCGFDQAEELAKRIAKKIGARKEICYRAERNKAEPYKDEPGCRFVNHAEDKHIIRCNAPKRQF